MGLGGGEGGREAIVGDSEVPQCLQNVTGDGVHEGEVSCMAQPRGIRIIQFVYNT